MCQGSWLYATFRERQKSRACVTFFCMLLENLLLPLDQLHMDAVELNGLTITSIIIQAEPIRRQEQEHASPLPACAKSATLQVGHLFCTFIDEGGLHDRPA